MLTPQINLDETFLGEILDVAMPRPGLFYVTGTGWCGYVLMPDAVEMGSISQKAAAYATRRNDGLLYIGGTAGAALPVRYELFQYYSTLKNPSVLHAPPATPCQSLLTAAYNIQMRGHFCANDYFGDCPPPRCGPGDAPIQKTTAVLNGVFMAKVNDAWLLCIAYEGQSYTHPHLRLIGGVKVGDYYFFDASAVHDDQRTAYTHTIGEIPLRDQRAPALSLAKDFPDYHHILECWANAAWQRESAKSHA